MHICAVTLHRLSAALSPFTANQTFISTFWASILFCFLFVLVLERLFWVRHNLVIKATNGSGRQSGRFGVYMCVCTQLCYSASALRSIANKSKSRNLKWQTFSPFQSLMFVLGYSAAFHSCVVTWFLTNLQECGSGGNSWTGQLAMILTIYTFTLQISCALSLSK